MSARPGTAGATRNCPHCKTTILESATICPSCKHYLRFDSGTQTSLPQVSPLNVEGTIRHPANAGAWEYTVVLTIRDDKGAEIARQVVGVGALQANEERTFTLAVEMSEPKGKSPTRKH